MASISLSILLSTGSIIWPANPAIGQISFWGMQWTTSKLNYFNQQIPCASSSLNLISGSVMIAAFKIIYISSEHYTTAIFSNKFSTFWYIFHCMGWLILNQCVSLTQRDTEYTARWTPVIGGGLHIITFLLERWKCQSFEHPTSLIWPILYAVRILCRSISHLIIFAMVSAIHLISGPRFLLGCSIIH